MNKLYTPLVLICFSFCTILSAQVSFTNQGALLGNINGSSVEDCAVDMNGDYLDDVVRVINARIFIDYQQGDGTFDHVEYLVGQTNLPTWSLCAGDIDGNGYNDLLFGGGNRVSFIYANDTGTAYEEDYHDEYIFSQRSTFADIDNDGNLDAFVCHDVDQSHPYRNDGNGNLTLDQTLIETIDLGGNYAAIWVDYDNDGDTDLYITKCKQGAPAGSLERTNGLYRNNNDGTYSEVAQEANMDDNAQSWATVFEDFDNDGDFDAFIVNHDFQNRLMVNNGDGTFTDTIETSGIDPTDLGAWENASGDFNNDGFVDIFSELSNELYLGNGDMTFTGQNLPIENGGIGDLNNDGFLDVIRGNGLWINDGNDNNWVKINTEGILSNKNGIGARVEIHGDWGIQIREIRSGQSFSPMSSLAAHFGIGTSTSIDSLVIKWPSGVRTKIDNPAINSTHVIPETDCVLAPSTLSVNGSPTICPGEQVEIIAPDGFDNYTWSNNMNTQSIMVSEAGSYSAVLSNNDGCISLSNSVTISVLVEENPTITVVGDDVFCQGESITLTASDGLNHHWSNDMTGQSIEVTETGQYFVMVDAICSDDPLVSEVVTVVALDNLSPEVEDVVITEPGPVTLTATTGQNHEWYDMAVGGNLVGTSNMLQIPLVDQDTTFYVESHSLYGGEEQDGGKPDDSGTGGLTTSGGYNIFDTYEEFTLLRVTVYVPFNGGDGNRTIQLVDKDNIVLAEKVEFLTVGQHEIELNFEVPEGEEFSLRCVEDNLFRNNSGVQYPYPIGDVGSIINSSNGDIYYYYFYNWKIQKKSIECVSERTPGNISIIVSTSDLGNTLSDLSIYPNPASDFAYLQFEAHESTQLLMRMFDATGKEVLQRKEFFTAIGTNIEEINTSSLAKGIYNIQLSVDGKSISKKLIIN
jgi:hypothetical protein